MLNVCVIEFDKAPLEMLCAYSHVGGGTWMRKQPKVLIHFLPS